MKTFKLLIAITIMLTLCACGNIYPDLEDDAIAFESGEFYDENYPDIGYLTIVYNGRIYMPYGTLGGTLKKEDLEKCVGYIVEDENISAIVNKDSKDTRVYTLTSDPEYNYLVVHYIASQEMNQPSFWRALDTKGEDINTPSMITSFEDKYWD